MIKKSPKDSPCMKSCSSSFVKEKKEDLTNKVTIICYISFVCYSNYLNIYMNYMGGVLCPKLM